MDDYYALLEVDRAATAAVISASYRRLARIKHPDKNPDNPSATALFQDLQTAYSVLKDAAARRKYDILLSAADVEQEQLRLFRRSRSRRHHTTAAAAAAAATAYASGSPFTTRHVAKDWHQTSGFYDKDEEKQNNAPRPQWQAAGGPSNKYPPSPPNKPVWPDRPPPTDTKLELDIRAARKDLRRQDKLVAALETQLKTQQAMTAALWRVADDVDQMAYKAQHRLAGLSLTEESELRQRLALAQAKLQHKAGLIQADLGAATREARRITAEIQQVGARKAQTEATLRELSRRWRIHHFGADSIAGDAAAASDHNGKDKDKDKDKDSDSADTGFDMWAAWGDDEGSSGDEPAWPACDVDPDWDAHQPYYDDIRYNAGDDADDKGYWSDTPKTEDQDEHKKDQEEELLVDISVDDCAGPENSASYQCQAGGSPLDTSSYGPVKNEPRSVLEQQPAETREAKPAASTSTAQGPATFDFRSVWETYKATEAARGQAAGSETLAAAPAVAPAAKPEAKPKSKAKPKPRPEVNVWTAQDGDLIDLGGGDDDDDDRDSDNNDNTDDTNKWSAGFGRARPREESESGPAIGEMPRRWYASGQAAHDAMRHDGWDRAAWQQSYSHEW